MLTEKKAQSTLQQVAEFAREIAGQVELAQISRLKGGRTSSVFLVSLRCSPVQLVVKATSVDKHNPLFDNRPCDEWRMLTELTPLGVAPMPVGRQMRLDGQQFLGYQFVPGRSGALTPRALATLLRSIHIHDTRIALPQRPTSPDELMSHAAGFGGSHLPAWALELRPPKTQVLPLEAMSLVHRDPIASNIITSDFGAPLLIDWQCPALGDPLEDIAHATSPAMAHVYGSAEPFCPHDILEHYQDCETTRRAEHLLPVYRWRMLCYCAWQVARGNQTYQTGMELEAGALEGLNSQK